jgi:hypothetical protein
MEQQRIYVNHVLWVVIIAVEIPTIVLNAIIVAATFFLSTIIRVCCRVQTTIFLITLLDNACCVQNTVLLSP